MIVLMAALDAHGLIGNHDKMPWHVPEELALSLIHI